MRKKFIHLLFIGCLFFLACPMVQANNNSFIIEEVHPDGTTTHLEDTDNYADALTAYASYENKVNNLLIREGDYIWKVKYGIVIFDTAEACDYNVSYTTDGENGYTNGCYGIDGAYLSTSDDQSTYTFQISGVEGVAKVEDIDLQPIETSTKISQYQVKDGKIYHQIKTQMQDDIFSSSIYLGEAPKQLQDDQAYYSYDGHYFYPVQEDDQGFYDMIDDLRAKAPTKAINKDEPYYNYYQYLSHRSLSSYSEKDINSYIDETLHIQKPLTSYESMNTSYHAVLTQSLLKDQAKAFLQYQNEFGANALMMMSLAMNESATGRSYLAFTRNNLFGHAAFDSAVEENASRYGSISGSIYSHAKHYINATYTDPTQFQYHGGYFGNKASGMNVSYASDPYWGEKAAQYYIRIDESLGKQDYAQYTIAIAKDDTSVKIYEEASTDSDVLYETKGLHDFAILVLSEEDNWYKIQSDPTSQDENGYDFNKSIGYLQKQDVETLLNPERMKEERNYIDITFDANDGFFQNDTTTLTIAYPHDSMPSIVPPTKAGWLFIGWDKEIANATEQITYTAQYTKVEAMDFNQKPKQTYVSGEMLDVSNSTLSLTLADGTKKEIMLDSSMVVGYDRDTIGEQILTIDYLDNTMTYPITVNDKNSNQDPILRERIETILSETDETSSFTPAQRQDILLLKQTLNEQGCPDIEPSKYRKLDRIFQKAYENALQVILQDDNLDVQVSGLSIAAPLDLPSFIPTILKLNMQKDIGGDAQEALENVAMGNDYTPEFTFSIDGSLGLHDLNLQDDVLVSIKKPENAQLNNTYTILQYNGEDVRIIPSYQSDNYISFTTDELGDFAIVSRASANIYAGEDPVENNSIHNNGFDYMQMLVWAGIGITVMIIIIITILIRRKRNPRNRSGKHPRKDKQGKQTKTAKPTSSFLASHKINVDEPLVKHKEEDIDV